MTDDSLDTDQELERLQYLWDGSQPWELHQFEHHTIALRVVFATGKPSVSEIAALRKLLPRFGEMPVQAVKDEVGSSGEVDLGTFSPDEGVDVLRLGGELGLNLTASESTYTSYLPVRANEPDEELILLIDDDPLAKRIYETMVKAGGRVVVKQRSVSA